VAGIFCKGVKRLTKGKGYLYPKRGKLTHFIIPLDDCGLVKKFEFQKFLTQSTMRIHKVGRNHIMSYFFAETCGKYLFFNAL
jgi:hypothetical protein